MDPDITFRRFSPHSYQLWRKIKSWEQTQNMNDNLTSHSRVHCWSRAFQGAVIKSHETEGLSFRIEFWSTSRNCAAFNRRWLLITRSVYGHCNPVVFKGVPGLPRLPRCFKLGHCCPKRLVVYVTKIYSFLAIQIIAHLCVLRLGSNSYSTSPILCTT